MANRLQYETSPYLLQHAHNPVHWYPWGVEALALAQQEQKIILVSIGYSACHWCHVMERESFEDPLTAEIMNRNFINIKIDREERPDLDQIYMDAVQAISGSGGWPLNVFLTPDTRPFYGGTYFPPQRAYNRSSWTEVLQAIQQAWQQKPNEIWAQAENLTSHIAKANFLGTAANGYAPDEEQLAAMGLALMKSADKEWGGFGKAPKFPQTMSIQWLLRQYYYTTKEGNANDGPVSSQSLLQQAELSLNKMIAGGLYDQLQGGFARYSTDERWLAPHFEKMLYDNALLVGVLSEAYQLTGNDAYKLVIEETMDFIAMEWKAPNGGFYSALDADSEGEEGKYYTWQLAEIAAILDNEPLTTLFSDFYNLSEGGNWDGTNILWQPQPLADFCSSRHLPLDATRQQLAKARKLLLANRALRPKPLLDDKKLMGWNALMMTACIKACSATGNQVYLQWALQTAQFIEETMVNAAGGYHHNEKNGKASNPAFLDDVAFYIEALCHLQEATGDAYWLEKANTLTRFVIQHYSDEQGLYFYYTPDFQTDILIRKIEMYDGATPSGNAVMVRNLLYLGIIMDEKAWQERARAMLEPMSASIQKYPGSFSYWAQMVQWRVYGMHELAIAGEKANELTAEVLRLFIPNKVLQQALPSLGSTYPLLKGKAAKSGEAFIYPCFQYTCQAPVSSVEALLAVIYPKMQPNGEKYLA